MWLTFNGCTSTSELNTELHDSWSDHSLVPIKFYDFCILFCAHQYHISQWEFCHTPRIYNIIDSLISWLRLFTESYLSDIDDTLPFENTTPINQNKRMQSRLIRLIGNAASVRQIWFSQRTHIRDSELMKLHIQGIWQNAHKFIRQLAHYTLHTLHITHLLQARTFNWFPISLTTFKSPDFPRFSRQMATLYLRFITHSNQTILLIINV